MSAFNKYLHQYAEYEVGLLTHFPDELSYQHVVVIPAYKEKCQFISNFLQSELARQNVLMILVVNQPDTDQDRVPQAELVEQVLALGQVNWQCENLTLLAFAHSNSACLIVDRFTQGVEVKQGVGLARKVGMDIACQLIQSAHINSQWLHSTDADALLPNDYFTALAEKLSCQLGTADEVVAACYPFSHYSNDRVLHQANLRYEQALRYYVAGLSYAQSPYAFFTIGSILAFKASAYTSVRGFPKKSAGEDFYLLNKLAKVGQVVSLAGSPIILTARTSDRVPFGTGPAVEKIIALEQAQQTYCYYHPKVFDLLKELLEQFRCVFEHRAQLAHWYPSLNNEIVCALQSLHFEQFIAKQSNSKRQQFERQLTVWFDAFRTLKFIHFLRDNFYPDIPLKKAIEQASFDIA
ncbi:glycosyltransferase family 2 protein [Thalassotalea sp. G2M2-11]|uniref:glycosyltransferase family 2 protein n=1 Tax=Thalassotalea sp. G2M2-11 TaxID=2787627 RepID=UPI0019CFCCD2|nr:glycosyltransferase family 2 protein [Thalassotalea sp. G2M2-11]